MLLSYLNVQQSPLSLALKNKRADTATHSTERVARRLAAAKLKMIHVFAAFPITAIWLLNKYTAEHTDALADIRNAIERSGNKKRALVTALRAFPFSHDDLLELTDLLVYVFQVRGLFYSPINPHTVVAKRLKSLQRLNKPELLRKVETMPINQYTFLSDTLLQQAIINVTLAEHSWLAARRQLVEANVKLVMFIARQYKSRFLELDDLVQEGQTGLLKAVDKFDYRLGFQFSTYAAYWIRQRILRALSRGERLVRVPCEQIGVINKVFRTKNELLANTGKEPTVDALATHLAMTRDEINTILSIAQNSLSLENSGTDDEDGTALIDVLNQQVFEPPLTQIAQIELEDWLEQAIKTLNAREAMVVCCHFGLHSNSEMTLQEIGTQLNISRERVRQIQVVAFNKMKLNYGEQLMSFL